MHSGDDCSDLVAGWFFGGGGLLLLLLLLLSTILSSSLVGGGFKLVPPLIVPSPLPSDDSAAGDWKADNETEESDSRVRVVLKDTEDASDAVEERSPAAAAEENADASTSVSDPK